MASQWLFMPIMDVISNNLVLNHHLLIGIGIVSMVLWITFHKIPRVETPRNLTDEETDRLLEEWDPEPLVTDVSDQHPGLNRHIISSKIGLYTEMDGIRCLNMASHNYLDIVGHPYVEQRAIAAIQKYGVGSCGPRGFYGTVDVHLELEERLARFMRMEEAAVYSYNFSTIASAIPAYGKRGDVIYVDEHANFAIQKGLQASRSKIVYFKHNNMTHLEKVIQEQNKLDKKNPTRGKARKQFLVVEGIYVNSGDICPLPDLVRIRNQYKLRIFIDESISFGTLGACGRGVVEHFGIPKEEVDLIVCSMEHAMASVGGFCVGSSFIVEHQRLSGLGYCFSASLPPVLADSGIAALDLMEQDPGMFEGLRNTCVAVHRALQEMDVVDVLGDPVSPVKHVVPMGSTEMSIDAQTDLLHEVTHFCRERGVAFAVAAHLKDEVFTFRPSIRVAVNRKLPPSAISIMASTLRDAIEAFLPSPRSHE